MDDKRLRELEDRLAVVVAKLDEMGLPPGSPMPPRRPETAADMITREYLQRYEELTVEKVGLEIAIAGRRRMHGWRGGRSHKGSP